MIEKIKKNPKTVFGILLLLCVFTEAFFAFKFHRRFIFLWDDTWYATNLVNDTPVQSISDIIKAQYWHYFNWGGRIVNHGILQFVLMQGELFADILNIAVTFLLSFVICKLANAKSILSYCIGFLLLFSLNQDVKLSMFWQSGAVNYLYSSVWIFAFLWIYIRQVRNPEAKSLPLAFLWMIPLGFMTGWSNENMGPASFLMSALVIFYFIRKLHRKTPLWMWTGMISSFIGSVLLILAPGNFIRNTHVEEITLLETLYDRFNMMLMAGASYLFPTVLFTLLFMFLFYKTGNRLKPYQIILMLTAILAYAGMALSPTFPNRAAFGIMGLCIVLICSFIEEIINTDKRYLKYIFVFALLSWVFGIYTLYACLKLPF